MYIKIKPCIYALCMCMCMHVCVCDKCMREDVFIFLSLTGFI